MIRVKAEWCFVHVKHVVHACFLMLGWFLCSLVFLCLLSVGGESSLLCCWIFFCFIIRYLDVVGSVPATLHTWVEFRIVIRLSHRRSREGQRGHASKIFRTYSHFVLWVFFPSKIVLFAKNQTFWTPTFLGWLRHWALGLWGSPSLA